MRTAVNFTGQRFGRWLVIGRAGSDSKIWRCICDCGTIRVRLIDTLRRGDSKSCGCLRRERERQQGKVDPIKALELSNAGLSMRRIAQDHFPNASHVAVFRAISYARKYQVRANG